MSFPSSDEGIEIPMGLLIEAPDMELTYNGEPLASYFDSVDPDSVEYELDTYFLDDEPLQCGLENPEICEACE